MWIGRTSGVKAGTVVVFVGQWYFFVAIVDEHLIAEYYDCRQQLDQLGEDFRQVITHPTYSLPFLQPGRLIKVKYKKLDFGWGVVINYQKRLPPKVRLFPQFRLNLTC